MTTAEAIVCNVLSCGTLDIETMFGSMTENDLFSNALDRAKEFCDNPNANVIWQCGIELAIDKVFGNDYLDSFEIDANCMASSASLLCDKKEIKGFTKKLEKFEELTGFTINY